MVNSRTSLAAPEAVRCGALVGRLRPCTSPIGDFNGVDIDELADGAFDGMAGFLDLLDLQTKPSKVQNPAKEHMILGVLVSIRRDKVVLQPTPGKIQLVSLSSTDRRRHRNPTLGVLAGLRISLG